MQINDCYMGNSIQDYLKKINSGLSWFDCLSVGATALCFLGFAIFIHWKRGEERRPVLYIPAQHPAITTTKNDSRPFASKNGTTYTFSWCSNSSQIKPANKIYFTSEAQAISSGRTLSKLCQK
jgi:hypothetical protein